MPDFETLSPEQVAVGLAELDPTSIQGFPRGQGWRPSSPLRLIALPAEENEVASSNAGFRLTDRHRAEDAATGEVRPALIHDDNAPGSPRVRVVLKFQRIELSQNVREGAVQVRLDEEHRALTHLAKTLPDDRKRDVPRSLRPDGNLLLAPEALEIRAAMVFCVAANHAIALLREIHADDVDGKIEAALEDVVGLHPSACEGCRLRDRAREDGRSFLASCRRWLVSQRESDEFAQFVAFPGKLLILDDMGTTLQRRMDQALESPTSQSSRAEALLSKLRALHGLAETIAAIHRANRLHLDLNLDNLCVDETAADGLRLRPIDFGHAEPIDAPRDAHRDRIPIRRVDFASAEMQLRSFPLRVRRSSKPHRAKDTETWKAVGLVGWPPESWPAKGDLLELVGLGGLGRRPPLVRIKSTIDHKQILEMRVASRTSGATRASPEPFIDANVHRSPSRASDLFSFGLIALCWLTNVQRPMNYRNELAVFERAISGKQPIDDTNWRMVYRRTFGAYSVLLDEALLSWNNPHTLSVEGNGFDHSHRYALLEGVRIAIKCIVRNQRWSFHARPDGDRHRLAFEAVAEDLRQVLDAVAKGNIPAPPPTPISIDSFVSIVAAALPIALSDAYSNPLLGAVDNLSGSFERLGLAGKTLEAVNRRVSELESNLDELDELWERTNSYETRWKQFDWVTRHVEPRIKDWFAWDRAAHRARRMIKVARAASVRVRKLLRSAWQGPLAQRAKELAASIVARTGVGGAIDRLAGVTGRLHRVAAESRAAKFSHERFARALASVSASLEPPWSDEPPDGFTLAMADRLGLLLESSLPDHERPLGLARSKLIALAGELPEIAFYLQAPRYFPHDRRRIAEIASIGRRLCEALAERLDRLATDGTKEFVDFLDQLLALRDASASLHRLVEQWTEEHKRSRLDFEAAAPRLLLAVLDQQRSLADLVVTAQRAKNDSLQERLAALTTSLRGLLQDVETQTDISSPIHNITSMIFNEVETVRADVARLATRATS